jgi:hypothetical protein
MAADLRRIPGGPGFLKEGPAGEGLAGIGDAAAAAAFAPGVRTRGEAPIAPALSGVLKTAQVAEFGAEGDGDRCLPRIADRGNGDAVFVNIHTDAECGRVRHR